MRYIRQREIRPGIRVIRRDGSEPLARVERVLRGGIGIVSRVYSIDYSYANHPEHMWKHAGSYELTDRYYRLTAAEVAEYVIVFGPEVGDSSWQLARERVAWIREQVLT